jgi:hypothetical protein
MRMIRIDLGEAAFRARLLDDTAPATCDALWNALPLRGRAVHAQWSGEMFRMYEPVDLGIPTPEVRGAFQHPGEIVYCPSARELAICYGIARFRGALGPVYCTPVAEIEDDLDALRACAARLPWDGAQPLLIAQLPEEGER